MKNITNVSFSRGAALAFSGFDFPPCRRTIGSILKPSYVERGISYFLTGIYLRKIAHRSMMKSQKSNLLLLSKKLTFGGVPGRSRCLKKTSIELCVVFSFDTTKICNQYNYAREEFKTNAYHYPPTRGDLLNSSRHHYLTIMTKIDANGQILTKLWSRGTRWLNSPSLCQTFLGHNFVNIAPLVIIFVIIWR